jgi:hypothetical protein
MHSWYGKGNHYDLWTATFGCGYDINDTRTLCPPAMGQLVDSESLEL